MAVPTVAIIYGFAEGPQVGRRLNAAIQKVGHRIIGNADQADIIITHSAGCYFLPPPKKKQIIILIDPPYWPGKSLTQAFSQKVYRDVKDAFNSQQMKFWVYKSFWNVVYVFADIPKVVRTILFARQQNFYLQLLKNNIILCRNEDDAWCASTITDIMPSGSQWRLINLQGQHDDCWYNPAPYVELLQSLV